MTLDWLSVTSGREASGRPLARSRALRLGATTGVLALALALGVLVSVLAAAWAPGSDRVPRHGASGARPASLPAPLRSAISRLVGRDQLVYRARNAAHAALIVNPRQRLSARLGVDAVELRFGAEHIRLSLRGIGYGRMLAAVKAAAPEVNANRVSFQRGTLTEWYVNGPLGLEQGFSLASPPHRSGRGPLTLRLAVSGSLRARLAPDRKSLRFRGSTLRYAGLAALDAKGRMLSSWLELERSSLLVRVRDSHARYPITIDPFVERAKLTASGAPGNNIEFGASVAVSGDTVVVGALGGTTGAAYVFVKPASGWASATETAKLTPSDGSFVNEFGRSVAIVGETIVVGAPTTVPEGAVYVFVRPAGGWASTTETAKLTASDGSLAGDFGFSVALSPARDTIVAGAHFADAPKFGQGALYVFVKPASGWASGTQSAKLTASDAAAQDDLGRSVAISGDTIVAGAPGVDVGGNFDQGAAYIFVRPATGWANGTQTAKLTASDGAPMHEFGMAAAASGTTVVVGAPAASAAGNQQAGAAYVFVRPTAGWASGTQTAKLTASDGAPSDELGFAVAAFGDRVVAGAPFVDLGAGLNQGAAYVFDKPPGGWASVTETEKLTASDAANEFKLGWAVAATGNTLVAGAPAPSLAPGAAYVFGPSDTTPPVTTITLNPASPNGTGSWYVSTVHAAVSATDIGGSGLAETRCVVDPLIAPTSFDDLPQAPCPYTGGGADITSDGQHTLYAASKDAADNAETPIKSVSFKMDQAPPNVTCGPTPTFTLGGPGGSVSATVTDATSGPTQSPISALVTTVDTATAGAKTKPLTGLDLAGNSATVSCPYIVAYQLLGPFPPLPKIVNGGATIPIKFALASGDGTRIPDAEAEALAANGQVQIFFTAGTPFPNCVDYDPSADTFQFDLKTPRAPTGPQTITVNVYSGTVAINSLKIDVTLK
jgi:FG-GAP repeat